MKKILSILGAITLIGTSSTSLVACNKNEYSAEELKELKEKNKINTKDKTIRDNLEWMASQETPFNKVDNKWYYVVWRGEKNKNWNLTKFNNNQELDYEPWKIDIKNNFELHRFNFRINKYSLGIYNKGYSMYATVSVWFEDYNNDYFKSVYHWNLDTKEPDLILDKDGNLKVNGE